MKAGNDPGPFPGVAFYLLAGPLIWSAHLFLVYGLQSALCAFRITGVAAIDPWLVPVVVGAVSLVSAALLLLLLVWPRQSARLFRASAFMDGENGSFIVTLMRLLAGLSLAGVLWAGATALVLDPCGQLR